MGAKQAAGAASATLKDAFEISFQFMQTEGGITERYPFPKQGQ